MRWVGEVNLNREGMGPPKTRSIVGCQEGLQLEVAPTLSHPLPLGRSHKGLCWESPVAGR